MLRIFRFCLLTILLFVNVLNAQNVDDLLKKIDIKLTKDRDYLNLYSLDIKSENINNPELEVIPRHDKVDMKLTKGKNIKYRFLLLLGGLGIDTMTIMRVDRITHRLGKGKGAFTAMLNKPDTSTVLNFSDIYYLSKDYPEKYSALYGEVRKFLRIYGDKALRSILGIKPDKSKMTMLGISARDNEDYLNFAHANSDHWYPYPKVKIKTALSRARVSSSTLRINLSFSKFTFSYGKIMDFKFGGGASIELNTQEKLLNLLPFESSQLKPAVRLLLEMNETKDLNKKFYFDLKFGTGIKINLENIFNKFPAIYSEAPRLNPKTNFFFDATFTRPFELPFLNFYFSSGKKDFTNPFVTFKNTATGQYYSYFNFTQFSFTMSFYWNSSDKKILRFGMDVGFGYHDIWRAEYNKNMNFLSSQLVYNKINPIVSFYVNFAPRRLPVFGLGIKHYASQLKINSWINLFEFAPHNLLRASVNYITPPLGRNLEEWENKNGLFFELSYRLGL